MEILASPIVEFVPSIHKYPLLESDPGETANLGAEYPALTRELKTAIMDWEDSAYPSRPV